MRKEEAVTAMGEAHLGLSRVGEDAYTPQGFVQIASVDTPATNLDDNHMAHMTQDRSN